MDHFAGEGKSSVERECLIERWLQLYNGAALVDGSLNKIHADKETTVEDSDFTSIQRRLYDIVKDEAKQLQTDAEKKVLSRVEAQQSR